MSQGLKPKFKFISQGVGNVTSHINLFKSHSDMFLTIPLYASNTDIPLSLQLIYTLSNRTKYSKFGNGMQLNYYKKITPNSLFGSVQEFSMENADGSVDKFKIVANDELDLSDTLKRELEKKKITFSRIRYLNEDTQTNLVDYSYVENGITRRNLVYINNAGSHYIYGASFAYPERIVLPNAKEILITTIYDTLVSKVAAGEEIVDFIYDESLELSELRVSKKSQTLYIISFAFDNNKNLYTLITRNRNSKVMDSKRFTFDFVNKNITVLDLKGSYRINYTLDNACNSVIKYKDGFNSSLSKGLETSITYNDEFTRVTDYKGRFNEVYFSKNGSPLYELDYEGNCRIYTFDDKGNLKSRSRLIEFSPDQIKSSNLVLNYDFRDMLNLWTKVGNGTATVPKLPIPLPIPTLPETFACIVSGSSKTSIEQEIVQSGLKGEILSFVLFGKLSSTTTEENVYATAKVSLLNGTVPCAVGTLEFKNNSSLIWESRGCEIYANASYDTIKVELSPTPGVSFQFGLMVLTKKSYGASFSYNDFGKALYHKQGGNTTKFGYNEENKVEFFSVNDSMFVSNVYDKNGNVRYSHNSDGVASELFYDSNQKLTKSITRGFGKYIETNQTIDEDVDSYHLRNSYLDERGYKSEEKVTKLLKQVKESKDNLGTVTTFEYNDFDFLSSYLLKSGTSEEGVSFRYDDAGELEYIDLEEGKNYRIYRDNIGRLKGVYVNNDGSKELTRITYLDEDNKSSVYSDQISTLRYGATGDYYEFNYNSDDLLSEVKFKGKDSNEAPKLIHRYFYDSKNRLEVYEDILNQKTINYIYDENNQLVKESSSDQFHISYSYDLDGNLTNTEITKNNYSIHQSFDTLTRSKRITPSAFFEGYKIQNENQQPIYSSFFNRLTLNSNEELVHDKNLTSKTLSNNGSIRESICFEKNGVSLKNEMDGFVPYIDMGKASKNLLYDIPLDRPNEYNFNSPSLMFWYKPIPANYSSNYESNVIFRYTTSNSPNYNDPFQVVCRIVEGNRVSVIYNHSGREYKITSIGSIKIDEWNHISLSFDNRDSDASRHKIYLQLNGQHTSASSNQQFGLNSYLKIEFLGNNEFNNGAKGKLASLIFTKSYLEQSDITKYYSDFQDYVLKYDFLDKREGTTTAVNTNLYHDHKSSGFNIVPLHNSFDSLDGLRPYKYSKKGNGGPDRDAVFDYSNELKRYVYRANGNELYYDFGLGNSATLLAKVWFDHNLNKQYIFENYDVSLKKLGLYREKNNVSGDFELYLAIEDQVINTGIKAESNKWMTVMLSWNLIEDPYNTISELGIVYYFNVKCDDQSFLHNEHLSYTYGKVRTSIGRRYLNTSTPYPLNGFMEMVSYSNQFTGSIVYDETRNKLKVTTNSKQFDELGLIKKKSITNDCKPILNHIYNYMDLGNDRIAPLITNEIILSSSTVFDRRYSYNMNHFVREVYEGSSPLRKYDYYFDGKLKNETCYDIPEIHSFEYYKNGNISKITKQAFDTTQPKITTFAYSNDYRDLLEKVTKDNVIRTITYDSNYIGNPTFYGIGTQGVAFKWEGRRLVEYFDNTKNLDIKYRYNDQGLRISKNVNGILTNYHYLGDKLVSETKGNSTKYFLYDEGGMLYGLVYSGKNYYYIRDILGNILGLVDTNGTVVLKYTHDAYGNLLEVSGILKDTLGKENPFLYKGYYYDVETSLYYCNSRYYVPEWCRWLSADDFSYLDPSSINGLNLFAYCLNNPIQYVDYQGTKPIEIISQTVDFLEILFVSIGKGFTNIGKHFATEAARYSSVYTSASSWSKYYPRSWPNTLGQSLDDMAQINANRGATLSKLGKIAKGIGISLLVLDLGLSAYTNFTDDSLTQSQKWNYTRVDWGITLGTFALVSSIGGPIGFAVGVAIWAICEYTGVDEWLKEQVDSAYNAINNGWRDLWDWVF